MKANKYLYIVDLDQDNAVIFNGINKEFVVVKKNSVGSFLILLKNPDLYVRSHKSVVNYFKSLGFILENEDNEQELLKIMRNRFIKSKEYKTSFVPTFECNYNCWYCIQQHEPVKIDMYKISLIVKHIKKYLLDNEIESYVLSWFGGEPLTQPNVIGIVTSDLKQFCKDHNIEFSASITTNGSLLNKENIEILTRNDVNYYQIAIDGDEKTHNKNKFDGTSNNSFALVLSNIVELLKFNSNAEVILRLNYTLATLNSEELVNDICKYIPLDFRRRIKVDLQKVWQVKEYDVKIDLLKRLQEALVNVGFELCIDHVFSMCYVEKEHYNMFFYNGGVEKCDKRSIDNLRGYINEKGELVWKEKPIFEDYDLFADDCICASCLYYPLCYNGCPVERENKIRENNGKITCGHHGDYSIFENRIQDYCWRVINNNKLNN